jgi:hypothetical protein
MRKNARNKRMCLLRAFFRINIENEIKTQYCN